MNEGPEKKPENAPNENEGASGLQVTWDLPDGSLSGEQVNALVERALMESKDTERVDEATRRVVEYLSAESFDFEDLTKALGVLAKTAPDRVDAIKGVLDEWAPHSEGGGEACEEIADVLPEYVELGEAAPQQMPSVADHLQTCRGCRETYEQLRQETDENA